jgi:methionyl-tRNA formyltransferase
MELTTAPKQKIERIVFMGTPEFAVPVLRLLDQKGRRPRLVVTQPDRPSGRKQTLLPPPVKVEADQLGIPVFQPENVNEAGAVEAISSTCPDLIVTAAYGGFLGRTLRNLPTFGAINLHPSLLPLYRGAAPVPFTLFDGRTETGITVFRIVKAMDAGPILMQRSTPIGGDEVGTTLLRRLFH